LLREDPAAFGRLMAHFCAGDPRLAPYAEPLARGEAVVVLSGQQPALLGGPLYTLYKTWTTIEAARRMRASGTPAVAAFWCVGDDTDHDEVRLSSWPVRAGAPRRLRDDRDAGGRRIGALEIERMAGALEALRADAPLVSGWTAFEAAASSATWSGFLEAALKSLAGDEPLLFVDGNAPEVLGASQSWLRSMAGERRGLAREISELVGRMSASGKVPGLSGDEAERAVFVVDGDGRRPLEIDRAPDAAMTLLPNVVLRPALQEHLLSVARVVCGEGEIAYRVCLGPVYARTGRPAAPLARRFEATLFPPPWGASTEAPDPSIVLDDPDRALDGWAGRSLDPEARAALDTARKEIAERIASLGPALAQVDRSLGQVVDSAAGKIDYQLQRVDDALNSKARAALLRRHPALANLREILLPRGGAQERSFSLWTPFQWEGPGAREGMDAAVRAWFDRGEEGHALLTLDEGGA
jgi:uncharacterized protein YllA (UPF0747 family)